MSTLDGNDSDDVFARLSDLPQASGPPPPPPPPPGPPPPPADRPPAPPADDGWLRAELEVLKEQVRGLSTALAHQQSVFVDIAGARTAELHDSLAQVTAMTGELRRETERLHQLQDAISHHLHDLVLDVVQPELRAQLSQGVPRLVAEAMAPELHATLADWLPQLVASTVNPEVRQLLSEWLPVMVADTVQPEVREVVAERLPDITAAAVQPEVRRVLAERLPHLVAETVQPEIYRALVERLPGIVGEAVTPELRQAIAADLPQLVSETVRPEIRAALDERLPELLASVVSPEVRQTLADRLPRLVADTVQPELREILTARLPVVVAEVVSPAIGDLLLARIPGMLADTITPDLTVTLAETEGAASELRQEAAKLRGLREVVADRLPESVVAAVEPQLRELLNVEFPRLVAEMVDPIVHRVLSDQMPALVAEAVHPAIAQSLGSRVAQLVAETVRPELRETVGRELDERLIGVVTEVVRPELRERLAENLPAVVAEAVTPEVVRTIIARLPAIVGEAVAPEMSVSLAEVEATAAEMRAETARIRGLREVVAERLPQAVMAAVQGVLTETLDARLPDLLSDIVRPALREAIATPLPAALDQQLQPALSAALARELPDVVRRSMEREVQIGLSESLPTLVASSLTHVEAALTGLTELRHQVYGRLTELAQEAAAVPQEQAEQLGDLREELLRRLPALVDDAVAAPLAEFESSAAQLRAEAERLRALRGQLGGQLSTGLPADSSDLGRIVQDAVAAAFASLGTASGDLPLATAAAPSPGAPGALAPPRPPFRSPAPPPPPDQEPLGNSVATAPEAVEPPSAEPEPEPAVPEPEPVVSEAEAEAEPEPPEPEPEPAPEPDATTTEGDLDVERSLAAALAPPAPPANGPRLTEVPMDDGTTVACVLPGVVVGPTLARGIGEAVSRARLRRRRRRRAGPPAAGLHRRDPFASELTRRLEWFALARRQGTNGAAANGPHAPGTIPVGERGGQEIDLPLGRHGAISLIGPRAREVARALVLTFLAEHGVNAARVIVVGDLFPATTAFPGLGRARDVSSVLTGLQAEAGRRNALFAEAGVSDITAYRSRNPDEPLPLVLVAAAEMTTLEAGRLGAVLDDGPRVGIAGVLVDAPLEGVVALRLQGPARIASVHPENTEDDLIGARLFTVEREPAAELLEVLASARTDLEGEPSTQPADAPFEPVPSSSALINVKLLGTYRIDVNGREVRSGLRAKAKELLAFYLLHPEGTTLEEATEALWPEADPRRGSEWFWTALGNLRSRLRSATENTDLKVIEREGDRYRIEPLFDVDLWRFESALSVAGAQSGDPAWAEALQEAAALYGGELLTGVDWPWTEVPREDLRGRAVDVLVSLAATRLVAGDMRGALEALERAIEIDPLAEQLYRRIMRLHAKLSRPDQADAAFKALVARLGEFDLAPSPESEKLHEELCGAS